MTIEMEIYEHFSFFFIILLCYLNGYRLLDHITYLTVLPILAPFLLKQTFFFCQSVHLHKTVICK